MEINWKMKNPFYCRFVVIIKTTVAVDYSNEAFELVGINVVIQETYIQYPSPEGTVTQL